MASTLVLPEEVVLSYSIDDCYGDHIDSAAKAIITSSSKVGSLNPIHGSVIYQSHATCIVLPQVVGSHNSIERCYGDHMAAITVLKRPSPVPFILFPSRLGSIQQLSCPSINLLGKYIYLPLPSKEKD